MKVYIPEDFFTEIDKKELFILVRPFFAAGKWVQDAELMLRWGLDSLDIEYSPQLEDSVFMLLPYPINIYFREKRTDVLTKYNDLCGRYGVKGYGYIQGDLGEKFPEFENLTYFRMGGFRSQLSDHNQGLPVALSDHQLRIYGSDEFLVRIKQIKPIIGFCGHASRSFLKRIKESIKFILENVKRAWRNPGRSDWEPIFPSAYYRACILNELRNSDKVQGRFILRKQYRAGVTSEEEQKKTTLEYYHNIRESDYTLCVRGGGNFSVRLYETLMMGRIPVFINTDCLLPFPDKINWHDHLVWVEWKDRYKIDEIVLKHYNSLSSEQFKEIQVRNRRLWKEVLSVRGVFNLIQDNI